MEDWGWRAHVIITHAAVECGLCLEEHLMNSSVVDI
jgi:hypothetical protein